MLSYINYNNFSRSSNPFFPGASLTYFYKETIKGFIYLNKKSLMNLFYVWRCSAMWTRMVVLVLVQMHAMKLNTPLLLFLLSIFAKCQFLLEDTINHIKMYDMVDWWYNNIQQGHEGTRATRTTEKQQPSCSALQTTPSCKLQPLYFQSLFPRIHVLDPSGQHACWASFSAPVDN